jgi:polyphosphate kinase
MPAYDASFFLSRELSWLEFNQRVLTEALDPRNPIFERVKFFAITSSNLDEFFEVRVAGVKQAIQSGVTERSVDGRTPLETFRAISKRAHRMVDDAYACWRNELRPALEQHGVRFLNPKELGANEVAWLEEYYRTNVRPVLTPFGIDPAHSFPQLLNKSLNLLVLLDPDDEGPSGERMAVVQVPRNLPRIVRVPGTEGSHDFVLLGMIIGQFLEDLFPGARITGYWHLRVTRNSELYIEEEESVNLLKAVEQELHKRQRGAAVRLEVDKSCPRRVYEQLLEELRLSTEDLYLIDGPFLPGRLLAIGDAGLPPEMRDKPFVAPRGPAFADERDLFRVIRQRDVMLHHPYECFSSVVEFLESAASDPEVLAIKQTLYRTGGDVRIVGALMKAAQAGKQVTAVTELKARFDEKNNIIWARRLEEAGVHVVYGIVNHKVHAKLSLVVRREDEGVLRRYLHVGTGNYNPTTAKIYTDVSLFTSDADLCEDAANLFNLLTGFCQYYPMRKLLVAPFTLHDKVLDFIALETEHARAGRPARIIAKMNSLVDREVIEALYRASSTGVRVDLIVRGICCLRAGVPGVSENIRVRSIIGRYLEHSRLFYFENGGASDLWLASCDWMPRNFFNRVEVAVPVTDEAIKKRILNELLATQLADTAKAWELGSDGQYRQVLPENGVEPRSSQEDFMQLALDESKRRRLHSRAHADFTILRGGRGFPVFTKPGTPSSKSKARKSPAGEPVEKALPPAKTAVTKKLGGVPKPSVPASVEDTVAKPKPPATRRRGARAVAKKGNAAA